ncbi:MAG: DUF6429 family protein [Steroidobacter sp.]
MQTYQIKVVLNGIEPPIWRSLRVPSEITLEVLHLVIQTAMGWHETHMHEFAVGQQRYAPLDDEASPDVLEEAGVPLASLINRQGDTLMYTYDFGDWWQHVITLEKILPPDNQAPRCISGERACPPEDCGGIPGYEDLLHSLRNPDDAHSEESIEWVSDFDPEYFNLDAVNEVLSDFAVESEPPPPRTETIATSSGIVIVEEDNTPQPVADEDKIDDAVLALLSLTFHNDHDITRAWKTFDWDALNRLHARGYIHNPVGKVKSVAMTEKGVERAKELFAKLFSR